MALDYEQHLSENLYRLYFEDVRYEPLRVRIKEECKDRSDEGLVFAVRKNEIHIYYRGGRLLKITEAAKGTVLKLYTDPKYAGENGPDNEISRLNGADTSVGASAWLDKIDTLKKYVAEYYAVHGNNERLLQHRLELHNRDFDGDVVIIDNEYGVRMRAARLTHLDRSDPQTFCKFTDTETAILAEHGLSANDVFAMTDDEIDRLKLEYKLCKVDLVALFKGDDGKYKICLTELKKGNGATGGKAGINDHIQDFKIFTGSRKKDIVQSVKNLIEYKTNKVTDVVVNYPTGGIELDEVDIYISILCYDLSSARKEKNVETEIIRALDVETKQILRYFHYNLSMKESTNYNYKLSRDDLLKNRL